MTEQAHTSRSPHQGQPVRHAGAPLATAQAAMLMVHGRGAQAEDMLSLAEQLGEPGFAYLAPQAAENAWYPYRFVEPLSVNEPWLSSALSLLSEIFTQIANAGIPPERTMLLGFSQGACLSLEYAARHARRYGGVVGLSGALIGPADLPRNDAGSLAGAPVFLGCSDVDPYVAEDRVMAAGNELRRLGGEVTERFYPNMGHAINQDEIDSVRRMMRRLTAGG